MSSPDRLRRTLAGALVLGPLTLGSSGCLRPMYGEAAGRSLQASLASIEIAPVVGSATTQNSERLGHYLRQELAFDLDGSGAPAAKAYRLNITVTTSNVAPTVDSGTGRADATTLSALAVYALEPIGGGLPVTQGRAIANASYDRSPQRFAIVRASRDAELRVARTLAEQIRTRLAATLASRG